MVHSPADSYRLLFEHTHSGSGLAGIEHLRLQTFQFSGIFGRHGSDAAHPLHYVEHQPFGLQQRAHFSLHFENDVARLHVCAVIDEHRHFQRRVEFLEHFQGNINPGKHTFFLYQQMLLAHLVIRYAAKRRMVAVAYILGKSQIQQTVYQFFLCFHYD